MSKRIKSIILGCAVVIFIATAVTVSESSGTGLVRGSRIKRPAKEGSVKVDLEWRGSGTENDSGGSMELTVNRQKPTGAALSALFDFGECYIAERYPENEKISGDIDFFETIPQTEIKLKWEPENYRYVNPDGTRRGTEIPREGVALTVNVTMEAYGSARDIQVRLTLVPGEDKPFEDRLRDYIQEIEKGSNEEWVDLPDSFEGKALSWTQKRSRVGLKMLLLLPLVPVAVILSEREKRKKAEKSREDQLLSDYPEVVSKMLLLLEAGMTVRSAWGYIVSGSVGERPRIVYEEMRRAFNEMENGISEVMACENFGKRCRLLPYMRFSGLLAQNLTKGSRTVLPLLEQEAINAFGERKEAAKRMGEEAGTKLIIPMIGILAVILSMIMFAAFQGI